MILSSSMVLFELGNRKMGWEALSLRQKFVWAKTPSPSATFWVSIGNGWALFGVGN